MRNVFRHIILNEINFKAGCALDKVSPDCRKCVREPACFVDNQQSVSTIRLQMHYSELQMTAGFACQITSTGGLRCI